MIRMTHSTADASHNDSLILFPSLFYGFCSCLFLPIKCPSFFLVCFPFLHYEPCGVCYLDSHKRMFSLKIWGKYSFEKKPIFFWILTKSLWVFCWRWWYCATPFGREKRQKYRREKKRKEDRKKGGGGRERRRKEEERRKEGRKENEKKGRLKEGERTTAKDSTSQYKHFWNC